MSAAVDLALIALAGCSRPAAGPDAGSAASAGAAATGSPELKASDAKVDATVTSEGVSMATTAARKRPQPRPTHSNPSAAPGDN
jgi:hypothetical protein